MIFDDCYSTYKCNKTIYNSTPQNKVFFLLSKFTYLYIIKMVLWKHTTLLDIYLARWLFRIIMIFNTEYENPSTNMFHKDARDRDSVILLWPRLSLYSIESQIYYLLLQRNLPVFIQLSLVLHSYKILAEIWRISYKNFILFAVLSHLSHFSVSVFHKDTNRQLFPIFQMHQLSFIQICWNFHK